MIHDKYCFVISATMFPKYIAVFLLLLTFGITLQFNINAQSISTNWVNHYSDKGLGSYIEINNVAYADNGNVYAIGTTTNELSGFDLVLLGLNERGDTILYKVHDDESKPGKHQMGYGIKICSDGNVLVSGKSFDNDLRDNISIFMFQPDGELLWEYDFNYITDFSADVIDFDFTMDNDIIIHWRISGNSSWISKISKDGILQSNKRLNGFDNHDYKYKLNGGEGTLVAFNSESIYIYDLQGDLLWKNTDLHLLNMAVYDVCFDSENNCTLIGEAKQAPNYAFYYRVVQLDANKHVNWDTKIHTSAYNGRLMRYFLDDNGSAFLACHEQTLDYQQDVRVVRIGSDGSEELNFLIPRTWGKWNEMRDLKLGDSGELFISTVNAFESTSYSNVEQKLIIYNYDEANIKWQHEIELEKGASYSGQIYLSGNNLHHFQNIEKKRDVDAHKPIDYYCNHLSLRKTDATINYERVFSSEGYAGLENIKTIFTEAGEAIIACKSQWNITKKKFYLIKYDSEGKLIWEYEYLNDDNLKITVKEISSYDSNTKLLLHIEGTIDANYINQHKVININASGNEINSKVLDYSASYFHSTPMQNNYYYLQYWEEDICKIACFNDLDELLWSKDANNSFVEGAKIVEISPDGQLIINSPEGIHKVDTEGKIVWSFNIDGDEEFNGDGIAFAENNELVYWRNKKVSYNNEKLELFYLNTDGSEKWSYLSDTISYGQQVWITTKGDVMAFGELSDAIYGRHYDVSTLKKFDSDGKQINRIEFPFEAYELRLPIEATDKSFTFIPLINGLVVLNEDGEYLGLISLDFLNYSGANFTIKNMDYSLLSKELSISGYIKANNSYTIGDWMIPFVGQASVDNLHLMQNSAPQITNIPDTIYGSSYIGLKAVDPDNDPLIFCAAPGYEKGIEVLPKQGVISINAARGLYRFAIRAKDPHGSFDEAELVAKIGDDNCPFILSEPNNYARALSEYSYSIKTYDYDRDVLTFSLSDDSPEWLSVSELGVISGIPPEGLIGETVDVKVIVYEETFEHTLNHNYSIYIDLANQKPEITSVPENLADVNHLYNYVVTYSDPEDDVCTLSIIKSPNWLSVDENSNTLKGIPQEVDIYNSRQVVIEINDGFGGKVKQSYTIDLMFSENKAPTITTQPILLSYSGFEYNYKFSAFDPENDDIEVQMINGPSFLNFNKYNSLLSGYIPQDSEGEYAIELRATDIYGHFTTQQFNISIKTVEAVQEYEKTNIVVEEQNDELCIKVSSNDIQKIRVAIVDRNNVEMIEAVDIDMRDNKIEQCYNTKLWSPGEYLVELWYENKKTVRKITKN